MTSQNLALAGLDAALKSLPPSMRHEIRNAVVCVRNTASIIHSAESWDHLGQDVREELLAELRRATSVLERTLLMTHTADGDT